MSTGKKPAHDASKLLSNPSTPKKVKEVSGSDLSQTKKPQPPKKKN